MPKEPIYNMYFLALICPPEVDKQVEQHKHWMKDHFGCLVALKSPAHITLIPPFWLAETREMELINTVLSFTSDLPDLEIQLDNFAHFRKKVLTIRVKENPALVEIKKQVERHFIEAFEDVIQADNRPFHPHVTIANRDMKPSDFVKAWEHFSNKTFQVSFLTETISLLKLSSGRWNTISNKNWQQQELLSNLS